MPLEINLINETPEYMPLEVNLNYILEQNNNSNNNQKVPSNNNNEKTINLTNIFNGIVGLFTYLFTIDNKSNNDNDNDNDII